MQYTIKAANDAINLGQYETFAKAITAAKSGYSNTIYAVFCDDESPLALVLNKNIFIAQVGVVPCNNCSGTGGWHCGDCNDSGIAIGGHYCRCNNLVPCEVCDGHGIVHEGHEPEILPSNFELF